MHTKVCLLTGYHLNIETFDFAEYLIECHKCVDMNAYRALVQCDATIYGENIILKDWRNVESHAANFIRPFLSIVYMVSPISYIYISALV